MSESYTSAGRLLREVVQVRDELKAAGDKAVHTVLPQLFGGPEVHWTVGLSAYERLANAVELDNLLVRSDRQPKYHEAIVAARRLALPSSFSGQSSRFADQHLTPIIIERLESMDEALFHLGRTINIEIDRASFVIDELDGLENFISSTESTPIDEFLLDKIRELKFVLNRYALYGPEGVEDAIGGLIGGLALRTFSSSADLTTKTKEKARAAYNFAKLAVDTLVYANAAADALSWSGDLVLQLLPPGG